MLQFLETATLFIITIRFFWWPFRKSWFLVAVLCINVYWKVSFLYLFGSVKEVVEKPPEENKQIEGINNSDVSFMVQGPSDMLSKGDSEIPQNEERLYNIGELSHEKQDLLSAHENYKFFKDNLKQSVKMNFPKTLKHGCNRSCKEEYLKNGFVYSKKHDAVLCVYCVLFLPSSKKQSLGAFVQRGCKE